LWPGFDNAVRCAVTVLRQVLVANQAICPAVDDANLERILTGAQRVGDIDAIGLVPKDSEILSIYTYLSKDGNTAKVEPGLDARRGRREVKGLGVDRAPE